MRLADISRARERLQQGADDWGVRISRIAFKDVPGIASGEALIAGPLFLIAGPNSVGKTTLLRAIYTAVVAASNIEEEGWAETIPAGTVSVDMRVKGAEFSATTEVRTEEVIREQKHDCPVLHINGATIVQKFRSMFPRKKGLDELISGDPQRVLSEDELAQVNYITGRQYRRVAIFELERDDQTVPFFEVSYGDDTYDTRTMGSGELAAFYLWWSLDRAEALSILLLEEPETFLSPSVQRSFADYLAVQVAKRTLLCIATTHSESLITPSPLQNVAFVTRGKGTIEVNPDPHPAVLGKIGIRAAQDIFVFVEDDAAKTLFEALLDEFNPSLARRSRAFVCGGEGEITRRLREIAGTFDCALFVGVYDGDQAGKINADVEYYSCTLPGAVGVEKILRDHVTVHQNEFEDKTGFRRLNEVLPTIEGLDDHDWFTELAAEAGMEKYQLMKLVVRMWAGVPENYAVMRSSYEAFEALLHKLKSDPRPPAAAAG
jgi:hypothetical protein